MFMNLVLEQKDYAAVKLIREPTSDSYRVMVVLLMKKPLKSALARMWCREPLIDCFAIVNSKICTLLLQIVTKCGVPHLCQSLSWGMLDLDQDHSNYRLIHKWLRVSDKLAIRKILLFHQPTLRPLLLHLVQWDQKDMEKLPLSPRECH